MELQDKKKSHGLMALVLKNVIRIVF